MKKILFLSIIIISGCMTAAQHQQSLHSSNERELTVGVVQKEIHVGMSQTDVAKVLGSPNIVTKDSAGKDSWVYDKIATEASYSSGRGGINGIGGAGGEPGTTLLLGIAGGGYSKSAGATSVTQKTLTIIIKFSGNNTVESFSYHSSKF